MQSAREEDSRKLMDSKTETMSYVDAHVLNRERWWPSVEHRPHAPRVFMTARNARRREVSGSMDTDDISHMSRSQRIQLLENLGADEATPYLDSAPTGALTSRRAQHERLIAGRPPLGKAAHDDSKDVSAVRKPLQLRTLHVKAAQLNPDEGEIDDGFNQAVATHRAALRGDGKAGIPMPDISSGRQTKRVANRLLRPSAAHTGQKPDIETMTGWLTELARAVDDNRSKEVLQSACTDQSSLLVKLSNELRVCAYVLRPHDALRAATLIAKSALLLETYQEAAATQKYNAERHRVSVALEDAVACLRSDMVAILAAVVTRITTADASYLADALLAMAESRAGRQEFLNAMLGHLLWLLAANPRSFQPRVVARIFWALGWMKSEGGADGETLSAISSEANTRAIRALQSRLVEVLDDFLEEDIGTLAMDPTGGAHLGDVELRRVLHRAGRLQVGLRPDSAQFLCAMRRLEASARSRLWEPYQAEIMPFMRDYCESLCGSTPSAEQLVVTAPSEKRTYLRLPTALG